MGLLERRWFVGLLANAFILQVVIILLRIGTTYDAVAIGLDTFMIGLIGGAFGALPAIIALHTGRSIDRYGERVALTVSALAALVASIGLLLVPVSLASLIVFNAIAGVAQMVGMAGHHSATAKSGGARQAARLGQLTMFVSLAHMAGPILFSLLARGRAVPETGEIYLAGLATSALLLAGTALIRIPARLGGHETSGLWRTAGRIWRTKGFPPATILSVVLFSATDLLLIYLPLFGTERGLGTATVGALLALRGAAAVVSRLFFGPLLTGLGRDRLLLVALLISGVALALIPFIASVPIIGGLVFAAGLGLGIGAPLTLAWIGAIIPAATMGSAVSLRLAINRVGQAALPVAVGALAAGTGATAVILSIGGSLLLSAGVSTVLERRKRPGG